MIRCQHGILPVPVPAVLNIAKRRNLRLHIHQDWQGERVTPTGAAFLAAVKTGDEIPENADITAVGYGAGKRDYEPAGILRAILFESRSGASRRISMTAPGNSSGTAWRRSLRPARGMPTTSPAS